MVIVKHSLCGFSFLSDITFLNAYIRFNDLFGLNSLEVGVVKCLEDRK